MKITRWLLGAVAALCLSAPCFAQIDGIEAQQSGSKLKAWGGGKVVINCTLGMTCTYTSGKLVVTSAAGAVTWRGAWLVGTAYVAGDAVGYTVTGVAYVAIASSTGVTPGTDSTKWVTIGTVGATGAAGATGATGSVSSASSITITGTAAGEIDFGEASANGANYVGLKAPDSMSIDSILELFSAPVSAGIVHVGASSGSPAKSVLTSSALVEGDLGLTDITTANVSTTKHGFTPKLPNDATKYLDGTGAFSVPAGAGGGSTINYFPFSTAGVTGGSTSGTTSYIGVGNYSTSADAVCIPLNITGSTLASTISVFTYNTPGTTSTIDFTFYDETSNASMGLTCNVSSASHSCTGSATVSPTANHCYSIKMDTNTANAVSSWYAVSVKITGGT